MRGIEGLLADRNDIVVAVGGIVYKYKAGEMSVISCLCWSIGYYVYSQLIGTVGGEMICHVDREMEIATAIEACISAIDVNPCFVVDGSEVQMCPLASPVCWHIE